MRRVALFARVSSEAQGSEDRHSIPAQLDFMRERCKRERWEIVREYVAVGESAFTGSLAKRPVLARAIQDARGGAFDTLMIHESSRLARNERLAHEILDTLHGAGVSLICADSPIDFATAEGRVYFGVQHGLNAYWSRKMAEHITKSKTERFHLGLPVGSLPLGYAYPAGPNSVPVPVENEARAIQRAFRMRAGGASLAEIGKYLEGAGLRPRSRVGYERFTVSSVQSLLENRFYAGFVVRRGEFKRGQHQPVVSEGEWLAAQSVTRHSPRASAATPALLAGLARCMLCGGPIWTSTTGSRGSRVVSYREPAHLQFRQCPASRRMWSCKAPDETVEAVVTEMMLDGEWLAEIDREARLPRRTDAAELARIEGQRTRANRAYIAGNLPEAEWEETIAALNRRAAELQRTPLNVTFLGERLRSMSQLWAVATPEQKRRALRGIFKAVYLDCDQKALSLEPTPEFDRLFDLRRRGVVGLPPAGGGGNFTTSTYLPSELLRRTNPLADAR